VEREIRDIRRYRNAPGGSSKQSADGTPILSPNAADTAVQGTTSAPSQAAPADVFARGRIALNQSLGMICRNYPRAVWSCGFMKYLMQKPIALVDLPRISTNGNYNRITGLIELNKGASMGDLPLATALALVHEGTHDLDRHGDSDNLIEYYEREMQGEALAKAFELIAFADYMAASGRLSHLDDRLFYYAFGNMGTFYEGTIDTAEGQAFINYMMDHPQASTSNDPEVFARAYAAGNRWVSKSLFYSSYYWPYK
jgi:hypothetical protein